MVSVDRRVGALEGTGAEERTDPRWRMLSRTAEYALRAVLHLAECADGSAVGAGEVASRLDVPERYLARVLNALARAGVLASTRGAQGGFRLAVCPSRLKLATVVAPFDAVGDPPQCLLRDQQCGVGMPCIAHARWHDVAGSVRRFFQQTTVGDLVQGTAAWGPLCDEERNEERR